MMSSGRSQWLTSLGQTPSLSLASASPAAEHRENWKEGDILEANTSQLLLVALASHLSPRAQMENT